MFEHMTYEKILQEMLDSVDKAVDKRPGSIIYDALAPAAFKLYKYYTDLDTTLEIIFLDTTTDEFLDRRGKEFSVERLQAVKCQREPLFIGAIPPNGSRFMSGDLYWTLLENGNLQAEIAGIIGNAISIGTNLIPLENIEGLTAASMSNIVIPGTEKEDDISYRARIFDKIKKPVLNSNKNQIEKWCKEITGIGPVKIVPLWNGPNTTKAVLLDTNRQPASQQLVSQVQNHIDPPDEHGRQGLGNGVADIGVIFTAVSATPLVINISVKVELASGKTLVDAQNEITAEVATYLKSIAFIENQVIYNQIGSLIVSTSSVVDYTDLLINNVSTNIFIPDENAPLVGTVTVT